MTTGRAKEPVDTSFIKLLDGIPRLGFGPPEVIDAWIPKASLSYIPSPDVVERSLNLIGPPPEQRVVCCEQIIYMIRLIHADHFARPTPRGEVKKQFTQFGAALKKAKSALKRISTESHTWLMSCVDEPELFLLNINLLIHQAESGMKYIGSRRGRHTDLAKANTSLFAFQLLRAFAQKPPTLTVNGP